MGRRTLHSPDGLLAFTVLSGRDEVTLGFEGCPWHTHADILAEAGLAGAWTVDQLLEGLVRDRVVIAVLREGTGIRDVWITEDPAADLRWLGAGERIEHRYWSGRAWRDDGPGAPR